MPSKVIELPSELTIKDEYCLGYDKAKIVSGLKQLPAFFTKIYEANSKKFSSDRLIMLLFYLGLYSDFTDASCTELVIDCEKLIAYHKKKVPYPTIKEIYALEEFVLSISRLVLDDSIPKNKQKIENISTLSISTPNSDMVLALKILATACGVKNLLHYVRADIRVLFENAPKPYYPPIEDSISFLPETEKKLVLQLHNKFLESNCSPKVERWQTIEYQNKKKNNLGSIFFYGYREGKAEWSIKLNLRNIDKYSDYLSECTDDILNDIFATDDCHPACQRKCGGILFKYAGKTYCKCPTQAFRFYTITSENITNYLKLIELEYGHIK